MMSAEAKSRSQAEPDSAGAQTTHRASTEGIDLLSDEQVLVNTHPGWSVWWKHLLAAGIFALFGLASGDAGGVVGGLVVGGGLVGYVYLARISSRYVVTNERVKGKLGLVSSKSREYRISDIESVTTEQSIMERILSLGNIRFRTAANDRMTWGGVPDHEQVGRQIRERRRQYD